MASTESSNAPALEALSRLCLALPEAAREDKGRHAAFTVRKKTFAYFLDDHHGDGIVAVTGKTALGDNEELVSRDPERYYLPAYLGPKGWVALRLDRGEIDWQEVGELVTTSYCLVAPRKLAAAASPRSA